MTRSLHSDSAVSRFRGKTFPRAYDDIIPEVVTVHVPDRTASDRNYGTLVSVSLPRLRCVPPPARQPEPLVGRGGEPMPASAPGALLHVAMRRALAVRG